MSDIIKAGLGLLLIATCLFAGCAWNVYAYQDCKEVGHSTFYCVMRIGAK